MDKVLEHTHIRINILTGEKVLISPHRTKRPWQGKVESVEEKSEIKFDKDCYLCPGNKRVNGQMNPMYSSTYVFDNDFPALTQNKIEERYKKGVLEAFPERGICKVVCFSPNHSLTLSKMTIEEIVNVITTWQSEFEVLSQISYVKSVQIFENRGEMMGCSNPHPHGQIWAQESIPNEILKKTINFSRYNEENKNTLLEEYLNQEYKEQKRIVYENIHFVVLVPFWAVWPYETMIIPKKGKENIGMLEEDEVLSFAEAIQVITRVYDQLFNVDFPYSSGIHQAPISGVSIKGWHWHMIFYPPLLRSASIKKFMVGYEMFAMPQRDITAEKAASNLREIAFKTKKDETTQN